MSTEENKALVRRFYEEVWNGRNLGVADEVFAADYVRHDLRPTPAPWSRGVEANRQHVLLAGGKVVEILNHRDDRGLVQQLGVPS